MPTSPAQIAKDLLESEDAGLEELVVHAFEDDADAHDDALEAKLHAEFAAKLDGVAKELAKTYGPPARTGDEDDDLIPLSGVFRFAIWEIGHKQLYLAAAHEDRGVPILLMLGTAG